MLAAGRLDVNAGFTFFIWRDYCDREGATPLRASMEAKTRPLEELRQDVDRIDRALVELLIERTQVVRRIGEVKGDRQNGRLAARPAREAVILRRLVALAGDRFPAAVLLRMWRELLAHTTRIQSPFSVAVFAPPGRLATWDLARDHFGSSTPMSRVESASQALRAVGDGSATVAVLPVPGDDDVWWGGLISDHHERVRVISRLPLLAASGEDDARALALARLELEASGDDLTLVTIEAETGVSRARLRDLLAARGFAPLWLAAPRTAGLPEALHLVEVDGFVDEGDERLAELLSTAGGEILRIARIGSYPRPLSAA